MYGLMTDSDRIDWLEEMEMSGHCPALLNDDNGHWAVVFDGIQSGIAGAPADVTSTYVVLKHEWEHSLRNAIDNAKAEYDSTLYEQESYYGDDSYDSDEEDDDVEGS